MGKKYGTMLEAALFMGDDEELDLRTMKSSKIKPEKKENMDKSKKLIKKREGK